MRFVFRTLMALVLTLTLLPLTAHAWDRGKVETFATLPPGTSHPEGLTVDFDGNVWVADFNLERTSGPGDVVAFDSKGKLLRVLHPTGSSARLLGLAFHPITKHLLVLDFVGDGASDRHVLDVNPTTGVASIFATIPGGAAAGPNALTFDAAGNVYISDSFQGAIFRTGMNGGAVTPWFQSDALLKPNGFPPFGANGLAFNNVETTLYVANTANDTIVKIQKLANGDAGSADVFVNSINGADGLIIDEDDNIWVCANQSDEIVVVNPDGRVIAKLGDFDGLEKKKGQVEPRGLLFPASLAFSPDRTFLYVSNLSLSLGNAIDAPWAAEVNTHTVARIRARIPKIEGLP